MITKEDLMAYMFMIVGLLGVLWVRNILTRPGPETGEIAMEFGVALGTVGAGIVGAFLAWTGTIPP